MKFTVDSWDPSYGVAADESGLDPPAETVDAGVEVAVEEWAPIPQASSADRPESVLFVDGVRRIDARIWVSHDGLVSPGVCATVAAGAVLVDGTRAQVVESVHHRAVFVAPDGAGPIATSCGTYDLVPCTSGDIDALYLSIHNQMTQLETAVSTAAGPAELLIVDGPLRGRSGLSIVGYVKTQHVQYLEPAQQRVLGSLGEGERTPLFLIGGRFSRWSWYLRLPGPMSHPLSGVIRCELPGAGTVEDASCRATVVTALLPRFASEPHKDPRAPQNLYPIAGLERELRRRLGDPALLERALRVAAREAAA